MTTQAQLCSLVALALLGGCAGGEMSRFGDADGVFSSSEGGSESDAGPTTDPTAADGSEGGPTSAPATDDGADESPSTTAPTTADDDTGQESSDGGAETTGEAESSGGESTTDATTTVAEGSSSDDGDDTAMGDSVDLSGWTIVQTDSAREIVLPEGTIVPRGGTLVVARNASSAAFQDFWGVSWGDDVVFIDGADAFPTMNGAETYLLEAPDGTVMEGPTPPLDLGTVAARTDSEAAADDVTAWAVDLLPNSGSTPGLSAASGGVSGTPFISEYADPTGAGNYVYEFVELGIVP